MTDPQELREAAYLEYVDSKREIREEAGPFAPDMPNYTDWHAGFDAAVRVVYRQAIEDAAKVASARNEVAIFAAIRALVPRGDVEDETRAEQSKNHTNGGQ